MKYVIVLVLLIGCDANRCDSIDRLSHKCRCEEAGGELVAVRRPSESPVDMRTYSTIEWICVVKE
jgi:hypothetical protein